MKMARNCQEIFYNILAWLAILVASGLALFALWGVLWLGYILGFKM